MLKTKFVSSMVKALPTEDIDKYPKLSSLSAIKGERVSFQLLYTYDNPERRWLSYVSADISLSGNLAKYATMREVRYVHIDNQILSDIPEDEDYISTAPGLFPDILMPLRFENRVALSDTLNSLWIEIDLPDDVYIENGDLTVSLLCEGKTVSDSVSLHFVNTTLPPLDIYMTQWFHCDCLATYYGVPVFSERHWEIIESFAKTAVRCGINTLLTPTLTPPLDTAVGGERPTAQLVGVRVLDGEYSFDFTLLDRWIDMCDRVGIKYLEIAHLFTQWGAKHAPKVIATVDGCEKKIFGWDTDALSADFVKFLRAFIKALISHLKDRGDDRRCLFHISDEPTKEQLESYRAAKATVSDLISDYPIIDALSDYEFYKQGVVEVPVCANDHISPFIENKAKNLWTYYCCGQRFKVSNRLTAMPSHRNRSIGMQIYKYDIKGFLQWGYNFYNSVHSITPINPYVDQTGGEWVPAGDAFSVYPAPGGTAYESLRIAVFHEALQDIRVFKLCEKLCGKAAVVKVIDEIMGAPVCFDTCAKSPETILRIRERINGMIEAAIAK